jgi:FkbM family methyltransferase
MGYSLVDTRIRGINYRLDIRDNTTDSKLLAASRFYDRKEIDSLARTFADTTDATFVDIGANTGYYSLNLARRGAKKIVAIEPNPPTVARLKFNLAANDMDHLIQVVPLCIGTGEDVPFYTSDGLGSASVYSQSHPDAKPIMVHTKPLLDILNSLNVSRIDGLKIDIEGYEDRCLVPFYESAPKSLWPRVVVIEYCNKDLWQRDVVKLMKEIGYVETYKGRGNLVLAQI